MIKFAAKVFLGISLLFSIITHASLITDTSLLTSDHYVTYSDENVSIDFAWVSPINVEFWGDPTLESTNQLFTPSLHDGWQFASDFDLNILTTNFTLADFTIGEGDERTFIHAVQFWNTVFDDVVLKLDTDNNLENGYEIIDWSNVKNFQDGLISSEWASSGVNGKNSSGTSYYETFYVRKTYFQQSAVSVPEPTTLMIFALALIALSLRSRLVK
ncbi:PEP-CTERM sorting domain-containing protein [Thalassotalea sp. G2M2-11]|uniref:PEP-CTERM sorting domain-containing protein n=1 Tax=Thalassotalea sp. G2M2-11 TaxID=2787627 RepID=UPI0019D24844|nr:PEP-CTERM sorting domain-containing protein [Thalassotalea sp. G2M2-11]